MSKNPVIDSSGNKFWYKNGQVHRKERHRSDGPAIDWADGSKEWYLNGERHREDGPACEWVDGGKSWWLNGQLHREDGPAIERSNGTKEWYLNGKRHRSDGPVEWANGSKSWYLNDKELSEDLHQRLTEGPLNQLPLYLGQGFDEYIGKRLRDE